MNVNITGIYDNALTSRRGLLAARRAHSDERRFVSNFERGAQSHGGERVDDHRAGFILGVFFSDLPKAHPTSSCRFQIFA